MPTYGRNWRDPISWLVGLLLLAFAIAAVGGLIIGAINLNVNEPDGTCTTIKDLTVSVNIWLIVYGSVGIVMLLFMVVDYFTPKHTATDWGWTWVWSIMGLFLVFPWIIVGQILLLGGSVCSANAGTFGFAVFALVMLYLLAAAAITGTSWAIYETQKDIMLLGTGVDAIEQKTRRM